jgi:hypothetical protein
MRDRRAIERAKAIIEEEFNRLPVEKRVEYLVSMQSLCDPDEIVGPHATLPSHLHKDMVKATEMINGEL